MSFWASKTVLLTGGTGFFGRHVAAALKNAGTVKVVSVGSRDYDLTKEEQVIKMYIDTAPDFVFHLAGLVGGIKMNKERPADLYYANMMMGTLVMHHAWKSGVKKFICASSGCTYPQTSPMPMNEEDLWDGRPFEGNSAYAIAKRVLAEQALAYHRQHGFNAVVAIPGNMYGEYDNFNLNDSHVAAALIRKFAEAITQNQPSVEVWGSGRPTRDYIYAGDAAQGLVKAAEIYSGAQVVNISSGIETPVKELVEALVKVSGYRGKVIWNTDKPDGQLRRCFDIAKAQRDFGFLAGTSLESGLKRTFEWYIANQDSVGIRK